MHGANVTTDQAAVLNTAFNDYLARQHAEASAAETAALENNVIELQREFGADYDRNVELARRAARKYGDDTFVTFLESKTVDGAPLGDHPDFIRAFARIGRSAGEAAIDMGGPSGDSSTLEERIRGKRAEIQEALDRGDHKRAHQLDREERSLWKKLGG